MKLMPAPHLLDSIRSRRFGWEPAMEELTDNSIDARATTITITFDRQSVTIQDDGVGCAHLEDMFRLGSHHGHAGGQGLGRYGVGLKDTAIWLWGETLIETVRDGRYGGVKVRWADLERTPDWDAPDPTYGPANGRPTGTTISFRHIEKRPPTDDALARLIDNLSFVFAPALKRGVRLIVKRPKYAPIIAQRFDLPVREHVISGDLLVHDRQIHVDVGLVPEGHPNKRPGFSYIFKHRVIIPASGLGCGRYNTSRIFGWVILGDGWRLTPHKDDISDFSEELGVAVEAFARPVLEMATQQSEVLRLSELESELTSMVRAALVGPPVEKEKRERGESEGTRQPRGTGRKRGAVRRQPGDKLPRQLSPGDLCVELAELGEDDGFGRADFKGNRVTLSTANEYVAFLARHADARQRKFGLFQLAISLVVHESVAHSGDQLSFKFKSEGIHPDKQFAVVVGKMLAEVKRGEDE